MVGLVVPTLNAEKEIRTLLDAVMAQTRVPDDILIVDSSSDDDTVRIAESYPGVRTMTIRRENFDHGGTRQLALDEVEGDFILFLTQDAVPADEHYVENLLVPFADPLVAMVYGRQLPKPNARRCVQLVQKYNYPSKSNVRSADDIERLGIKAFFASDVCSAYRRSAYETIGGFPRPCATNEDMLAACRFLRAGHKVAYESNARIMHSHNLTLLAQYRRNRAVGEFLARYSEELNAPSEVDEGGRLVKTVANQLMQEGEICELCAFVVDCGARLIGNRVGRAVGKEKIIRKPEGNADPE
ncbi:glycosyltransferase family 2 protein [Collinsella intestinalis]|uniref:glycosyltransferase family 2 protein n=1 Tax=Collinsella intestinalis TaxID=147207 RepID=UPI00195C0AB9|nr:glycosyltransferase family A protein [Collinsella intestinalis]MBM6683715.1 glycosyltransferase family 2 protein [Collinsella intestinalis]